MKVNRTKYAIGAMLLLSPVVALGQSKAYAAQITAYGDGTIDPQAETERLVSSAEARGKSTAQIDKWRTELPEAFAKLKKDRFGSGSFEIGFSQATRFCSYPSLTADETIHDISEVVAVNEVMAGGARITRDQGRVTVYPGIGSQYGGRTSEVIAFFGIVPDRAELVSGQEAQSEWVTRYWTDSDVQKDMVPHEETVVFSSIEDIASWTKIEQRFSGTLRGKSRLVRTYEKRGEGLVVTTFSGGKPSLQMNLTLLSTVDYPNTVPWQKVVALGEDVSDLRLGDGRHVQYKWTGELPSLEDLRRMRDGETNHLLVWGSAGFGLVACGVWTARRSRKKS